jgi:purine-nucleoside phosphorylase
LALMTLTDDIIRDTHLSPEERETGFGVAARLAIAAGLTA